MKKISTTTWVIVVLLAIIFVLGLVTCNQSKKIDEKANFIDAMNDTLKIVRNKDSSTTASITAFRTDNYKQFLALQSKDATILRLQQVLKDNAAVVKNGGSVTTVGTSTGIHTHNPNEGITYRDTVVKDSLIYIYPEYFSRIKNLGNWFTGDITANRAGITLNLEGKDSFDIVVGFEKNKPIVKLTSHNPYVTVTELRSIHITQPKPKRLGVSLNAGYGVIFTDNKIKLGPYVGAGLSYNLFFIK